MLTLFRLIFSATIFSFILSSSIEPKQFSGTWYEAVKYCKNNGTRILSISDIYNEGHGKLPCKSGDLQNTKYWIGNYYKLSDKISVKGCYRNTINNNPGLQLGYQSLYDCYGLCAYKVKAGGTFAYKNVNGGGQNCFCQSCPNSLDKEEKHLSECLKLENVKWWTYKIHLNLYPSWNETCSMVLCTNNSSIDHVFGNKLCGLQKPDQTQEKNLRYVCTNNTDGKIPANPGSFNFILNDSNATDLDQRNILCKSIACSRNYTPETIVANCTSNLSGVLCLNGIDPHLSTTLLPASLSSINVPINRSEPPANNSSHRTTIKSTSKSSSHGRETYAPPRSSLHTEAITQEDTTSHFQNTKTSYPTPSAPSYVTFSMTNRHTVVTSPTVYHNKHRHNLQSTSTKMYDPSLKPTSTIGLLVGLLSTAFVIVIVVAVLLVICRLQRKGPFKNKRFGDDSHVAEFHCQNDHNTDIPSMKEPHIVNNSTYEMHTATENVNELSIVEQNSNNIPNSEYAVVIKKSKMNDNTPNKQRHDEENLDVIENEYDGLNHNRPDSFTNRNNTTNMYDTALGVRDTCDSTYVTANHVHVVDKDENCVYDHM